MIKKYLQFINEADEVETAEAQAQAETETPDEANPTGEAEKSETDASDSSKFVDVIDELKSLIESTIKKSGGELSTFVESYIKNPNDVKIEKLINDADVYEFYLKWRNDIDEILSDINYFDELPSENNAFGLYEYTIKGTQKAILEFVKMIK